MKAPIFLLLLMFPAAVMAAGGTRSVSFRGDIAPVLKTRCVACHLTGTEAGKLALHPKAAYASLVGRASSESRLRLVDPGKPDTSYLLMKLEGTHISKGKGMGARMPFGQVPLDAGTVDKMRRWIADGAPDN